MWVWEREQVEGEKKTKKKRGKRRKGEGLMDATDDFQSGSEEEQQEIVLYCNKRIIILPHI